MSSGPDSSSFASLLKRLEAATSRLEEIAVCSPGVSAAASSSTAAASSTAATADGAQANGNKTAAVADYERFLSEAVKPFLEKSTAVGSPVLEQANLFQVALERTGALIQIASQYKKPSDAQRQTLMRAIQEPCTELGQLRETNRKSPLFNHLSAVSEGSAALMWPLVEPAPVPYLNEMKDSAQFYSNRVLKEFKDKDKMHVEWVNALVQLFASLAAYVKQHHTTGLAWNAKGQENVPSSLPTESSGSSKTPSGSAAPSAGAPPPPPPPPVMTFEDASGSAASAAAATSGSSSKGDMSKLFSELSKGEGITAGLKKVDKSQMTHKNPELRASSVVKAGETPSASRESVNNLAASSASLAAKKPARVELEGNKWIVENQENNNDITIDQTDLKHTVYIYNCKNCTVQIKGKINSIVLDRCVKTAVVLESVLSSIESVQTRSSQLQILGSAPTLMLDKTDGFQVYLSRACMSSIQILTAKCSEINIMVPGETDQDDYVERPVPEQYRTIIGPNGELQTTTVQHAG